MFEGFRISLWFLVETTGSGQGSTKNGQERREQ